MAYDCSQKLAAVGADKVVHVFDESGELSLIEYGQNDLLGSCRTEHMSPYLISMRINAARGILAEEKKMAYLVDKQTVKVMDLLAGVVLATVSHGVKIDWLVRLAPRPCLVIPCLQ